MVTFTRMSARPVAAGACALLRGFFRRRRCRVAANLRGRWFQERARDGAIAPLAVGILAGDGPCDLGGDFGAAVHFLFRVSSHDPFGSPCFKNGSDTDIHPDIPRKRGQAAAESVGGMLRVCVAGASPLFLRVPAQTGISVPPIQAEDVCATEEGPGPRRTRFGGFAAIEVQEMSARSHPSVGTQSL